MYICITSKNKVWHVGKQAFLAVGYLSLAQIQETTSLDQSKGNKICPVSKHNSLSVSLCAKLSQRAYTRGDKPFKAFWIETFCNARDDKYPSPPPKQPIITVITAEPRTRVRHGCCTNTGAHLRFTTFSTNVVLLQILYFNIFTGFVLRHETNHWMSLNRIIKR